MNLKIIGRKILKPTANTDQAVLVCAQGRFILKVSKK